MSSGGFTKGFSTMATARFNDAFAKVIGINDLPGSAGAECVPMLVSIFDGGWCWRWSDGG